MREPLKPNGDPNYKDQVMKFMKKIWSGMPHLLNLPEDEKRKKIKMADGRYPFMEKALHYGKTYREYLPSYIDLEVLEQYYTMHQDDRSIYRSIMKLASAVKETYIESGSISYSGALDIFNQLKEMQKHNIPGIDTAVEDMRKQLVRKKRNQKKGDNPEEYENMDE